MAAFPTKAFVQKFADGALPPESKLVMEELQARGIEVEAWSTEDIVVGNFERTCLPLQPDHLVVGDFDWTRMACKQLGVPMPQPPDYPSCLRHLLHRRVWQSTLADVKAFLTSSPVGASVFLKPAIDTKAFSGLLEPQDQMLDFVMEEHGGGILVWCSEVITIVAEYRVYVVDGKIRAVCQYKGPADSMIDLGVVEDALRALAASEDAGVLVGCGMDFGVVHKGDAAPTALIEVNDGYSLGWYAGISGKDYTDMLAARWSQLVRHSGT